jgi:hypothetical protein
MTTIDKTGPLEAVATSHGPCISIYVSRRAAQGAPADWARLRGLLKEAEGKLEQQECQPDTIRELLAPLYELSRQSESWQYQGEGFALFRAPGSLRWHPVSFPVAEEVAVGGHFYLAPLFRASDGDQRFYVLALSLCGARLFEAFSGAVTELRDVAFPPGPATLEDQTDGRRHRQRERSVKSGFAISPRRRARDNRNQALHGWFRKVDDVLRSRLGTSSPPVILFAVQYLCPIFRRGSRYQNLLEREIHGSPDGAAPATLWERGWKIASTYFQCQQQKIAGEYLRLWHTSRASNDMRTIEIAARQGRIQTLFLGMGHPGKADATDESEPARDTARKPLAGLLELAALNTFMTGGTVYLVPPEQVPGRASAAAVLRY